MKYDLVLTGKFKKGLKLAKKRGLDIMNKDIYPPVEMGVSDLELDR